MVGSRKITKKLFLTLLFLVFAGLVFFLLNKSNNVGAPHQQAQKNNDSSKISKSTHLKKFSGIEFSQLYNSFAYPNTQQISSDYPITGDPAADKKIKVLAETRGYRLRSAPVTDTFVEVAKGMKLQQRSAQPWLDMQKSAKKDGFILSLTAAYRSAKDERTLLISRLKGISASDIASGREDNLLNKVLANTSAPGYSRHHTGYTIDIACDNDKWVTFKQSSCFKWLSANNYQHAKEHGWIPSYPDGAGKQGPEPEPWEYVWVGIESLVTN